MPTTLHIDHDARLVRVGLHGPVSGEEMLATIREAAEQIGPEGGYAVLSDHREIGEPATRDLVERVVDHLGRFASVFHDTRWAVVVGSPASYGMMRMLGVLAEQIPMTVRVFLHDVAAAEQWALRRATPPGTRREVGDVAGPDAL